MDSSMHYYQDVGDGYHDQHAQSSRRLSSKKRHSSAKRKQRIPRPDFYNDHGDNFQQYEKWQQSNALPLSTSSSYMTLPPYDVHPGVPGELDLYMEGLNLHSTTSDSTLYDYDSYPPNPSPYYHEQFSPKSMMMDPMMYGEFYEDMVYDGGKTPLMLSRQSSSRLSEPKYQYRLPHSGIPAIPDDHLMAYDTPEDDDGGLMMNLQDNGDVLVSDGFFASHRYPPIRPDPVQRSSNSTRGRQRQKRPQLQRSHSIATTAHQHYLEPHPPSVADMHMYDMDSAHQQHQQEPPYFQQSFSAPNSPKNRRFHDGPPDEELLNYPGLRRSNSMQVHAMPPMMMNGPPPPPPPSLQRRHSLFEPGQQHHHSSPDFMGPVANSAPGTPWMSSMEPPPSSHMSHAVLPTSMPSLPNSSLGQTSSSTLGGQLPHSDQHQQPQQPPPPPPQSQSFSPGHGGDMSASSQHQNGMNDGNSGGGGYFQNQQMANGPMNPILQQQQPHLGGDGRSMPLPTPPSMMGMRPMISHPGASRAPPPWNNDMMMSQWDPMMMMDGMNGMNRMDGGMMGGGGPRPFGFDGGGPMMMNPMGGPMGGGGMMGPMGAMGPMGGMMGGPMGGMMGGAPMGMMMPPGRHEDMTTNKSKDDKKTSKDKGAEEKKEKSSSATAASKEQQTPSLAAAAAASGATTTPEAAAAAEQQLPPLNAADEGVGLSPVDGALVRSMDAGGPGFGRKPSIWNLFGLGGGGGGGGNRSRSMMMNHPYAIPGRPMLPHMAPPEMMMNDLRHGEHPKLAEMVDKFRQLMYVWCYVIPMENYQTAWCTFKIQNQRKLNHADRHGQRAVTLDKEKSLPGTVIVNPLSKTAVMYKSLWSTTKMIITIMRLPQEEYQRQQHALSPELMRRWGSKRSRNPYSGYATGVFNSMFRDYQR